MIPSAAQEMTTPFKPEAIDRNVTGAGALDGAKLTPIVDKT